MFLPRFPRLLALVMGAGYLTGCATLQEIFPSAEEQERREKVADFESKIPPETEMCKGKHQEARKKLEKLVAEMKGGTYTTEAHFSDVYNKKQKTLWDEVRKDIKYPCTAYNPGNAKPLPEGRKPTLDEEMGALYYEQQQIRDGLVKETDQMIEAAIADLNRFFLAKAVDAKQALMARLWIPRTYNVNTKVEDGVLRDSARRLSAMYDVELLAKFKEHGGLGKFGPGTDAVGCLVSSKPFPKNLDRVAPVFATHIESKTMHVACRLPKPAKTYGSYTDAAFEIAIEVVDGGTSRPVSAMNVGTPASFGGSHYVTGTFEMPPGEFANDVRWFFTASTYLNYKVKNRFNGWDPEVQRLSRASFTWHRP